ncbi:Uncharacterised protein [uncultured archaeon]|nr:Uncharacterised protein [uncultured archaeon]
MAKKTLVYLIILLLTAYPASASELSLDRWVLNVTLNDNGLVDETIQAEILNSDTSPLDGISFFIPSSKVTMIYDFSHTFSSTGLVAQEQTVQGGTRINLIFNESVKAGDKWDGRIGFTAENMAVKEGKDLSINIPVQAPQAIVSGKNVNISVTPDSDIRSQVFLPKAYEVMSVQPEPFKDLFQYGLMVPTWTPEKLHIGDTISIKASYSDVLAKIASNDDMARKLKADIKVAKDSGKNVSEAETYLSTANDNNNKALATFGGKDYTTASQFAAYANDQLTNAENSLKGTAAVTQIPKSTGKTTPGFEAYVLGFVLLITVIIRRKNNKT